MKILVVEDHVLMREALRGVLKELKGDAAVIVEAPDSHQAMRQIEQNPDVELVLLDLGLPIGTGSKSCPNLPSAIVAGTT
jgi:DNA-binding NarL/FixJ family response regulator